MSFNEMSKRADEEYKPIKRIRITVLVIWACFTCLCGLMAYSCSLHFNEEIIMPEKEISLWL